MRQVPGSKYLIIGNGRLATHLTHYFLQLKIPVSTWNRSQPANELKSLLLNSKKILLAIKDDAIASFIDEYQLAAERTIHFSGTLSIPGAIRMHPLMTFANVLYPLEDYKKIPFTGEVGSPSLQTLIPELNNPYYVIPKDNHDLYHALCVVAGPGSQVLWQQVFNLFEDRLQLPREAVTPYLERVFKNLLADSQNAVTGPWVRDDVSTIEKNQNALKNNPLANVYTSLLNAYLTRRRDNAANAIRSL